MPKNKNKGGTTAGNMPSFSAGFDPTSNYGRTKTSPYLSTSAGHHAIQQDKQGYLGYVARMGGANLSSANPSAFGSWLQNNKFADIENSYGAARNANPELSFAHYTQSIGIPGNPGALQGGGAGGNAYAASSQGVVPGAAAKKGKKGKPPAFNQYAQGVVQSNSTADWMAQNRREFARLTPQQQGTYSQGYAFGPAGWSVF